MIRSLFGIGFRVDLKRMLLDGALIVDVRTPVEFDPATPRVVC